MKNQNKILVNFFEFLEKKENREIPISAIFKYFPDKITDDIIKKASLIDKYQYAREYITPEDLNKATTFEYRRIDHFVDYNMMKYIFENITVEKFKSLDNATITLLLYDFVGMIDNEHLNEKYKNLIKNLHTITVSHILRVIKETNSNNMNVSKEMRRKLNKIADDIMKIKPDEWKDHKKHEHE